MAQEIRSNMNAVVAGPAPAPVVKAAPAAPAPKMAADNLQVKGAKPEAKGEAKADRKPPSPSAAVPGEEVRNGVSLTNTILGPLVTAQQALGMLANASFKSRLMTSAAQGVVNSAGKLSKFLPFLKSPIATKSLTLVSRGLPFISAGILAFDAYATVRTFMNPEASGMRKALTAGRFLFNAIATAVTFIPGAGFIYSMPPAMIGNVFELAMAKMNSQETAKK